MSLEQQITSTTVQPSRKSKKIPTLLCIAFAIGAGLLSQTYPKVQQAVHERQTMRKHHLEFRYDWQGNYYIYDLKNESVVPPGKLYLHPDSGKFPATTQEYDARVN